MRSAWNPFEKVKKNSASNDQEYLFLKPPGASPVLKSLKAITFLENRLIFTRVFSYVLTVYHLSLIALAAPWQFVTWNELVRYMWQYALLYYMTKPLPTCYINKIKYLFFSVFTELAEKYTPIFLFCDLNAFLINFQYMSLGLLLFFFFFRARTIEIN